MKKYNLLKLIVLMIISGLSHPLSTAFAQDSIYIYQAGVVVSKRAVLQIDSMSFSAPKPAAKASACGAYIASGVYKQFLCKNLGAPGDLYSGGLSYNAADNGDLYQWGRPTDGHEKRNSATTTTLSTSNTPGNANFVITSSTIKDWRDGGGNNERWTRDTKAANDPCPTGYKVPREYQWRDMVSFNTKSTWANGYSFGDNLFLPAAGYRYNQTGIVAYEGDYGGYWSSSTFTVGAIYINFNSSSLESMGNTARADGYSVRCIAE